MEENRTLVVGFAFATPASAFVNKVLRFRIEDLCARQDEGEQIFVFTQPDLGTLLPYMLRTRTQMIREEEGKPSPTLRIAREAIAFALKYHITRIRIVAAGPHMWRCLRDMKMAMKEAETLLPLVAEKFDTMSWSSWFHESSTQPRTKSPLAWLPRDILLRLMSWEMYKRKAS